MRSVTITWDPAAERFIGSGSAAGRDIVIGAPRSEGSRAAAPEPTGFSATELLLAGAGACALWDMVEILRKQRQDVRGMAVQVDGEQAGDPPWEYRRLTLRFELSGPGLDLDRAERAARLSVERYCSVIATLRGAAEIDWQVRIEEDGGERVA